MPKTREVRVTIEVLAEDGETLDTATVLCDATGAELDEGGLGDIQTAIDDLLSDITAGDEDDDED